MQGLTEVEAQRRLKAEGYNELPQPDRRTPLRIALEVLREPMLALLLGGGVVYLLLGDLKEAIILLVFAMLSIVITVVQEARTERVLEALRDLTSPRALVIRDGERKRIAGREVVRDDLLVLSEGDRIPADAALVQSHDLQTDELLLTGESMPVRKVAAGNVASSLSARPGGDDLPFVFSGSLVVRGAALARVTATGAATEIGKIGQIAERVGNRTAKAASANPQAGAGVRRDRRNGQRVGGPALRLATRGMARCHSRRHFARHGDVAGRVSGRADGIHGHGRLADFAGARAARGVQRQSKLSVPRLCCARTRPALLLKTGCQSPSCG